MNKENSQLQHKIEDYTRFAHLLLLLSVFFYLGVLFPGQGRTDIQLTILMIATILFLSGCFFFYVKVKGLVKLLEEE